MPIVYACIAPHGSELVPVLAGKKSEDFSPTRKGMRKLARELRSAEPETIVVASPHNLRLLKHIGVVVSKYSSGTLREGAKEVSLKAECDVEFAGQLIDKAESMGLPVVGANFGGLEGPLSDLAMDWGTLVPLWFFLRGGGKRRIVIVTPSRGIPLRMNFEFGRALGRLAEEKRRRVAFVASADQAHAHRKDGPYGYSPRAKEYDSKVMKVVESGEIQRILDIRRGLVDRAKPDSLWQIAILAGVTSVVPMEGVLVSYQVPTYYGMLCAGFQRRWR